MDELNCIAALGALAGGRRQAQPRKRCDQPRAEPPVYKPYPMKLYDVFVSCFSFLCQHSIDLFHVWLWLLFHALYIICTEHICCCICNRRRVVDHYNLGENYIQTCCLSIFCSCCACCQEMYEVSVREGNLGKPCPCACCWNCVHAGHAKGSCKRFKICT